METIDYIRALFALLAIGMILYYAFNRISGPYYDKRMKPIILELLLESERLNVPTIDMHVLKRFEQEGRMGEFKSLCAPHSITILKKLEKQGHVTIEEHFKTAYLSPRNFHVTLTESGRDYARAMLGR